MALPITVVCLVTSVGLAGSAGGDGREHVLLEPDATSTLTLALGAPIKLVIDEAGSQGLFTVGQSVSIRFT